MGRKTQRLLRTTATELQFVDDAVLGGSSREEIERAVRSLDSIASECCVTVCLPKIKQLVAGTWNENGMQPTILKGESIKSVSEFKYLGSVVEAHDSGGPSNNKLPAGCGTYA